MEAEQSSSDKLFSKTVDRLKRLIATPSLSREEQRAADLIESLLQEEGIAYQRKLNNVWAFNHHFDPSKPTILLNSHIDTVKPAPGYTIDPFKPLEQDGKLYGLGSNDAGAALLCLFAVFTHYYHTPGLSHNLVYAATAEEEISGLNGIEQLLPDLGTIDLAIIGEPTEMHLAIAEKGLLVLDCVVHGKAGHAAREEGENAIYKALKDIEWFRTFRFPKISDALGEMKMSVTMIEAGTQHNILPSQCRFTVDIRCTDAYTHEEVLDIVKQHVQAGIIPRSMRLRPSSIDPEHAFVQAGLKLGRRTYGSPTTSDQALIPYTSVKMGPGNSARSHQADEFIFLHEIKEGIDIYIQLLDQIIRT